MKKSRPAVLAAKLFQKKIEQCGNVLLALAKRRHQDRKDVEAEEKIFPELSVARRFGEVDIRGRNDSYVHFVRAGPPQAFEFAFLEETQDFGLNAGSQLADFVQEDRALVSFFETARFGGRSTRERGLSHSRKVPIPEVVRGLRHS